MFGIFGKTLDSFNISHAHLLKTGDENFDEQFTLYSDDQNEVREKISAAFRTLLLDFKFETGKDIYISILNSHLYVAIPVDRELFKPYIFKSNKNLDFVKEYFKYLTLMIKIIEELEKHQ